MQLTWNAPQISVDTAQLSWAANHATDVHEGAVYTSGSRGIARPYTTVALAFFDVADALVQSYREKQDISEAFTDAVNGLGKEIEDVIDNYDWGISSTNSKVYRDAPTWETITDSGELRESQSIEFS